MSTIEMTSSMLFVLERTFKKFKTKDNERIFWRECNKDDSTVCLGAGYIWVYQDGNILHSYQSPEMCDL